MQTLAPSIARSTSSRIGLIAGVTLLGFGGWSELLLSSVYEQAQFRDEAFLQTLIVAGVLLAGVGLVMVAACAPPRRAGIDLVALVIGTASGIGCCAISGASVVGRNVGEIDTCITAGWLTLASAAIAFAVRWRQNRARG